MGGAGIGTCLPYSCVCLRAAWIERELETPCDTGPELELEELVPSSCEGHA